LSLKFGKSIGTYSVCTCVLASPPASFFPSHGSLPCFCWFWTSCAFFWFPLPPTQSRFFTIGCFHPGPLESWGPPGNTQFRNLPRSSPLLPASPTGSQPLLRPNKASGPVPFMRQFFFPFPVHQSGLTSSPSMPICLHLFHR